ncbi:T-cell surface glycoprotein CD3 epsilon chain isoform X2 [Sceloporus undulatus]|uniref:T-cell surface glycoprotein CD3 epsilon chain isoform X2 n=1 Tax=Sceloporus undulatus TaxID=8520 RepID=UPI001C4D441A|nr:T-cell surface glycoprotein CD3 epsilon chain isoform X2 [Sceloporus undulatus]XP_042332888.1 T-cell surface glycoprotein CD3 epsilon chain isoform X2 [Sceloporus undulatus]
MHWWVPFGALLALLPGLPGSVWGEIGEIQVDISGSSVTLTCPAEEASWRHGKVEGIENPLSLSDNLEKGQMATCKAGQSTRAVYVKVKGQCLRGGELAGGGPGPPILPPFSHRRRLKDLGMMWQWSSPAPALGIWGLNPSPGSWERGGGQEATLFPSCPKVGLSALTVCWWFFRQHVRTAWSWALGWWLPSLPLTFSSPWGSSAWSTLVARITQPPSTAGLEGQAPTGSHGIKKWTTPHLSQIQTTSPSGKASGKCMPAWGPGPSEGDPQQMRRRTVPQLPLSRQAAAMDIVGMCATFPFGISACVHGSK